MQKLIVSLVHYGLFPPQSALFLFKLRYCEWERACCHFNPLTWTATEKLVLKEGLLLMWLFYGYFHIWSDIIFNSNNSPARSYDHPPKHHHHHPPSSRNAWKPKHSLSLYHRPHKTPGLLIHLRIILKQIPFNRQGQKTMKTCDSPALLGSSWWGHWALWAGSEVFYGAHIRVGRRSGCLACLNPATGW